MSSTAVHARLGFAVVAALLVAGCGGGTAKNAASTTTASSTTPATSTASAPATGALADSPFCKQLSASMAALEPSFTGGASNPAQLGAAMKKEAELVHSIQPPAEIAADWKTLSAALDAIAANYGKLDPHNPASATAFLTQNQAQLAALETAAAHLGTYLSTNCGIAVPTGLTAAPSS